MWWVPRISITTQRMTPLAPRRTIAELKELRALTGAATARNAWLHARLVSTRAWLNEKLEGFQLECTRMRGQFRATLRAESEKALRNGSGPWISVPNGGWLDGCLNVVAGVEIIASSLSITTASRPSLRLVDLADRKARRRKSLFGSVGVLGLAQQGGGSAGLVDKQAFCATPRGGPRGGIQHLKDRQNSKNAGGVSRAAHRAGAVCSTWDFRWSALLGTFCV